MGRSSMRVMSLAVAVVVLAVFASGFHSDDAVTPLEDIAVSFAQTGKGGTGDAIVGTNVGKSRVIQEGYEMPKTLPKLPKEAPAAHGVKAPPIKKASAPKAAPKVSPPAKKAPKAATPPAKESKKATAKTAPKAEASALKGGAKKAGKSLQMPGDPVSKNTFK